MSHLLTDRFKRAYQKLPIEIQHKVKKALRLLNQDTSHPSLRVKKIQGTVSIYEARVDKKYRMSFQFSGDDILLRNVDNHDECLKNP